MVIRLARSRMIGRLKKVDVSLGILRNLLYHTLVRPMSDLAFHVQLEHTVLSILGQYIVAAAHNC